MNRRSCPTAQAGRDFHNKQGEQAATQKNEGKRTPDSRSDREANIRNNEAQMKQAGTKSGNQGSR